MKKDTQQAFRDPALQGKQPRKPLRLDVETLRVLTGGGSSPDLGATRTLGCPPTQHPFEC